jgi:hypothetical protein
MISPGAWRKFQVGVQLYVATGIALEAVFIDGREVIRSAAEKKVGLTGILMYRGTVVLCLPAICVYETTRRLTTSLRRG